MNHHVGRCGLLQHSYRLTASHLLYSTLCDVRKWEETYGNATQSRCDHRNVLQSSKLAVCIAVFTLDAGLMARSQYSEGPATGHIDTGFSRFPCVYKQMLRRFPTFQVATTCFSCSPPDLNLLVTDFIFCVHVK